MIKKLMKYDLIWINKFMLIYFSITGILTILTKISEIFNSSFVGNIIYLVLRGCLISAFVSVLINCVIRIWVRFNNNLYKDESYLTHTLPVEKNTLYNSKIISSVLSLLLSLIVIVICFMIVFLNNDLINVFKNIFSTTDGVIIFIGIVLIAILEFIYMMGCGLIGIILGNRSNNNKTIKSVFIGIASYFIIQIFIVIIAYLTSALNTDLNSLFTSNLSNIPNLSSIKMLILIVNILYIIFITCMYFIGKKIFNKGVNVE